MKKNIVAVSLAAALALSLTGCGNGRTAESETPAADEPQVTAAVQLPAKDDGQAAPSGSAAPGTEAVRQDGERFEAVIVLEGMEETVRYEHIRNDAVGFEMDYDYELFVRQRGADRERFVSCGDDPGAPENYLEVKYSPLDAEAAAAAIGETLSCDYDISRNDSFMLERSGSCIQIDASADKGGLTMPEHLQAVYIIPAEDGCRVATAHYALESAEGFGRRIRYFMDSFSVIAAQGERRLTNEQAVSAIRNYCFIRSPDLEDAVNAGEYSVNWDILSSGENEIVVEFRSYTGSLNRYYIDPVSGDAYVTELVPGIIDEEQRTDESLNVWEYVS